MRKTVHHITIAAVLASLGIVINVITRSMLPGEQWFPPLFVLPIIIGSIILGPVTGGLIGLIVDIAGFYLGGGLTFLPLMVFSRVMWGVLPFFFFWPKQKKVFRYSLFLIGIFITHIVATTINSLALYIAFDVGMLPWLAPRLMMLPANVVVLTFLTIVITHRMPIEDIKLKLFKNLSKKPTTQEQQPL